MMFNILPTDTNKHTDTHIYIIGMDLSMIYIYCLYFIDKIIFFIYYYNKN